jgi:hypothetical protein
VAGAGGLALILALGLDWYSFSLLDVSGPAGQDPTLEREDNLGP